MQAHTRTTELSLLRCFRPFTAAAPRAQPRAPKLSTVASFPCSRRAYAAGSALLAGLVTLGGRWRGMSAAAASPSVEKVICRSQRVCKEYIHFFTLAEYLMEPW